MAYLVEFATRAARDLEILYKEKNPAESHAAARWSNGLEEAVYALASFPQRCPVAPEARRGETKAAAPALRQEAERLSGHL
jgi:hypothetical protein